jgi:hypothetical protein
LQKKVALALIEQSYSEVVGLKIAFIFFISITQACEFLAAFREIPGIKARAEIDCIEQEAYFPCIMIST